jgi:hypothetical protein
MGRYTIVVLTARRERVADLATLTCSSVVQFMAKRKTLKFCRYIRRPREKICTDMEKCMVAAVQD